MEKAVKCYYDGSRFDFYTVDKEGNELNRYPQHKVAQIILLVENTFISEPKQ